jgi:hypothetical protein
MKLPDAVIEKLRDQGGPVTHTAILEGGEMTIRYTCDGKQLGKRCSPTREKHGSIGSDQ